MRAFLIAMVFVALIVGIALAMAGNIGRMLDIRRYEAQAVYTQAQAQLMDERAELVYAETLQQMAARQSANTTALYVVIGFLFLLLAGAALALVLAVVQLRMTQATLYQMSAGNVPQLQPGQRGYPVQMPVQAPIYNQEAQR